MGPGKDFEKGRGIISPPIFEPDQDLLVWRKKVASWVDLIATAAEKGEDKLYKTIFCTLGRQLYDRGLRQAQQSLFEEAQEQGKIDYKQEDQMKAVQEIVELVAKDPPIAVVTRLIDSFNKVTTCKRKANEDLNRFISRFRGLAAEHLMRASTSNHSQIGEVLAITLLNNASLSEATLTNAKLRLIGMAEERAKLNTEPEAQVNLTSTQSMVLLRRVGTLRKTLEKFKKDSPPGGALVKEMNQKYNHVASALLPTLQQSDRNRVVANVTKAIASNGPRCILSLDDAVAVLRSLAQTGSKSDQVITKAQMDSAVEQKVRSFLSNQKKDRKPNSEKNWKTGKRSGSKRKLEQSARRNERKSKKFRLSDLFGGACMDCGDNSHIRGDPKCKSPSFATLKIQEAKTAQDSDETDDENQSNEGGYFRPGSKHTKGN